MVRRTMRQRVATVAPNAVEAERPPDIIEDIRFWSKLKVNFVDFIETLQRPTLRTDETQWRRIQKAVKQGIRAIQFREFQAMPDVPLYT